MPEPPNDEDSGTIALGPFGRLPLTLFYAVCVGGGVALVMILLLFIISSTVFL